MADEPQRDAVCEELEQRRLQIELEREYRPTRYDAGQRVAYDIKGVCPADEAQATFLVERFVGGGFAGQVYRVRVESISAELPGLEVGARVKLKIIKPPSRLAHAFRNALFWIGYQGCFSAQVNEAAARGGALWQTVIQRGAAVRFGRPDAVSSVYATFWDPRLRSFGEVGEWVEGRQWRFELDDRYFDRYKVETDETGAERVVGPPEYLAKRAFMRDLVELLHEMGAPELARQYEWWTMKSQPNALKRTDAGEGPGDGLTAIDFRAGLALLPFLPMSPADVALIWRGLKQGRFVQFDRGDLDRLDAFVREHADAFQDLQAALEELRRVEPKHRESLPDVTHHRFRLLTDSELRRRVALGAVTAWRANALADDAHADALARSRWKWWGFWLLGALPFVGKFARKCWAHARFRRHVGRCLTSARYLWDAMTAARIETLIDWRRDGRVNEETAWNLVNRPALFWFRRLLFGWLPATWQRFCTDDRYAWEQLRFAVQHPWRLMFDGAYREQWLTEQVLDGVKEGMLTEEESQRILGQLDDPFIQRYLKSLAVHVCTLPVTQIVSVAVAVWAAIKYGKTREEALAYAAGVLALFQVTPISPGSFTRGAYAVYVTIRDRNFKRYRLAVFISFWKYIGYLAFPIQMAAEYPALAQFMAGRWATGMVHIIPVFGERGALLEHTVFDLFFNVPLTWRRWRQERRERKAQRKAERDREAEEGKDSNE